jgi:hypothetical protein
VIHITARSAVEGHDQVAYSRVPAEAGAEMTGWLWIGLSEVQF